MRFQAYNNSSEILAEEQLRQEKLKNEKMEFNFTKWQSAVNSYSLPKFTKFGNLELAEKVVPLYLLRKVRELYSSIVDAKNVLLNYKSVLSTTTDIENNCITPLAASKKLPMVFYKREDLTSIKAYKIRGALYQMSKIIKENPSAKLKFIAASTGNHALGVLKAAEILKVDNVTICISKDVTDFKKQKLHKKVFELNQKDINAKLIIEGDNFDQTNQLAQELAEQDEHSFYIDPYNTHNAVAGQGTIGLELLSQLNERFLSSSEFEKLKEITVIVPIGGGGLISGISCALKSGINSFPNLKKLKLRVIGIKLENLDSKYGDAIKVKVVGEHNDDYIKFLVERKITVNDIDMKKGINFINDDLGVKVEGASAGTLKPVLEKIVTPSETNAVICIISGSNTTI